MLALRVKSDVDAVKSVLLNRSAIAPPVERIFYNIFHINVKCYVIKECGKKFLYEKSNYITSSYLGLFKSSRPQSFIFKNFSRKYRW